MKASSESSRHAGPAVKIEVPYTRRQALTLAALYAALTVADIASTTALLSRGAAELNPCTRGLLSLGPAAPILWFARDMAVFLAILALIALAHTAVKALARRSPRFAEGYFRLLEKAYLVLLAEAVALRALPLLHNIYFAATGRLLLNTNQPLPRL